MLYVNVCDKCGHLVERQSSVSSLEEIVQGESLFICDDRHFFSLPNFSSTRRCPTNEMLGQVKKLNQQLNAGVITLDQFLRYWDCSPQQLALISCTNVKTVYRWQQTSQKPLFEHLYRMTRAHKAWTKNLNL